MRNRKRFFGSLVVTSIALLGGSLALSPSVASAGVVTSVEFSSSSPVTVEFGGQWTITLSVSSRYDEGPTLRLQPTDGTVDVYFSGIGGAFASSLPIQPDGLVYVSQPVNQPLLPAGDYEVSAIYNPAGGGYYNTSQTTTPLKLTITPLTVTPVVEVVNDAAVSDRPVITASVAGSYVDVTGGAPAGTWNFAVENSSGETVFDAAIALTQGSTEPLRLEVDSTLEKGGKYVVRSSFVPVDELAGGLVVAAVGETEFQTPAGTFGEAMTGLVPLPLGAAIALLVLVLGAAAAAIVLGVKLARRSTAGKESGERTSPRSQGGVPGDPYNIEIVSLGDLGLPEPETIPELLPEGHTVKMPVSTTWLLSDVEPATGLPDASEAQTERLDTIPDDEQRPE